MNNPILNVLKRHPKPATAKELKGVGFNIGAFAVECLAPRDGSNPSILHVWEMYRAWCASKGVAPIAYAVFIDDFLAMAKAVNIAVQVEGSHIVLQNIGFYQLEAA